MLGKLLPRTLGGSWDSIFSTLFERAKGCRPEDHATHLKHLIFVSKPKRIMEIGVQDGLGARAMVEAARKAGRRKVEYYGFDLFGGAPLSGEAAIGEARGFRRFLERIRYKILLHLKRDSKKEIQAMLGELGARCYMYKGDSRLVLPEVLPGLPKMDFIHIDGGHDYETCKSDWENARKLMSRRTIVVFDDYPMEGVRRVVEEIKRDGSFKVRISGGHAVVTYKR